MTEDETVGCHRPFNGHELGQTPGGGERQGHAAVHEVAKSQARLGN